MTTKTPLSGGRGISDVEASDIAKELRLAAARVCEETAVRISDGTAANREVAETMRADRIALLRAAEVLRAFAFAK